MTRIKLCGLMHPQDIAAANQLQPDYVGFVFAPGSHRQISADTAAAFRRMLDPDILAVGVFVDAAPSYIADLLNTDVIDIAQLHGREGEACLAALRRQSRKPLIQAFRADRSEAIRQANASSADWVLLDSGAGSGSRFDWTLLSGIRRPYFLAGGLTPENIPAAIEMLHPYALDVSSGIETDRKKDPQKMAAFVDAVRSKDRSESKAQKWKGAAP